MPSIAEARAHLEQAERGMFPQEEVDRRKAVLRQAMYDAFRIPATRMPKAKEETVPRSEIDAHTTDYCARCGQSPESGVHLHDHPYLPPVPDVQAAVDREVKRQQLGDGAGSFERLAGAMPSRFGGMQTVLVHPNSVDADVKKYEDRSKAREREFDEEVERRCAGVVAECRRRVSEVEAAARQVEARTAARVRAEIGVVMIVCHFLALMLSCSFPDDSTSKRFSLLELD